MKEHWTQGADIQETPVSICMSFIKPLNISGLIGVWTQIIKVLLKELCKYNPCPKLSFEEGA